MSTLFEGLGPKIKAQYKAGIAKKAVIYTESEVEEADEEGIPFEIRFAPALSKKPTKAKDDEPAGTKPDPFMPPYVPELFVAEDTINTEGQDEGFVVLLNKYCILPRHFLLVTKDFDKQTAPVTPTELLATYSIIKQLGVREKHLCFFNSGAQSGASQAHKHFQFIPIANGVSPFDAFIQEHKPQNTKAPFQLPLPYANFTVLLSPPLAGDLAAFLFQNFFALLDLTLDHIRRLAHATDSPYTNFRLSDMSFNLILTETYLQLIPRLKESYVLPSGEDVSINALGFAGNLLTKSEEALNAIKEIGVLKVLSELGYPPVAPGQAPEEEPLDPHTD